LPKDELNNGPVKDRGCTDVICCLLFVVFIVSMVGLSGWAMTKGNPMKLLTTFDQDSNACGIDDPKYSAGKDYPFLYFPALQEAAAAAAGGKADPFKYPICVKSCPKETGPISCLPLK
jgi:hypothetical protein